MKVNDTKMVMLEEIQDCGNFIMDVFYKPKGAPIVCGIISILLIITLNWIAIILGVFVLAIILFVQFKIEDYKTMTIYDRSVVIYDTHDLNKARKVCYEDVEEWTVKSSEGISDAVMLKLKDGEVVYKDTFQTSIAYKQLNKIMPEKESRAVQAEKNKQRSAKFKFKFPSFNFKKK